MFTYTIAAEPQEGLWYAEFFHNHTLVHSMFIHADTFDSANPQARDVVARLKQNPPRTFREDGQGVL